MSPDEIRAAYHAWVDRVCQASVQVLFTLWTLVAATRPLPGWGQVLVMLASIALVTVGTLWGAGRFVREHRRPGWTG